MDLATIKAGLVANLARRKAMYKNESFGETMMGAIPAYDEFVKQSRGIYGAGTAPTEAQQRERNPISNTPDDSLLTRAAKSIYNTAAPDSMQVGVNYGGMKHFNTDHLGYQSNKEFNNLNPNELAKRIQDTPDDPNGAGTFYYLKVIDGYDNSGNPHYVYKAGTSADSAFQRYLGELRPDQYEVVASKRTNAYQDLERLVHGNKSFMQQRTFAEDGMHHTTGSRLVSGNSELYNKDVLGLDKNQTAESYKANRVADYQKFLDNKDMPHNTGLSNWGASLGSGAINLAGKGIKAFGELESTQTDNNFLTRAGQSFIDNADKYANYDRHDQNLGGYQMQSGVTKLAKGDVSGLSDMFNGIITGGPEAFLNSTPEMVVQTAGGMNPVGLAAKAGVLLSNTNDQLDNRLKNTGTRKDATWEEKAGVLASQAFVQALDTQAFKIVTNGAKTAVLGAKSNKAIPLDQFLNGKPPSFISAFARGLTVAAKGSEGIAVEGLQEASQEAINILQEQLGTSKYKDKSSMDILYNKENLDRIATAASQGAIAGGSVSLAGSGLGGIRTTMQEGAKAIDEINRRNQATSHNQGDAELNSRMMSTVKDDAVTNYKALDQMRVESSKILSNQEMTTAQKLDALNSVTQSSEVVNNAINASKSSLVNQLVSNLADEQTTQLHEILSNDPTLGNTYNQVVNSIASQVEEGSLSETQIQQDAIHQLVQHLPIEQSTQLFSNVAPDVVNKVLSSFDSKAAEQTLNDVLVNQQNLYGEEAGQFKRNADYYNENAPKIDSTDKAIDNLGSMSSRGLKRAQMNVQDVLSKMSTEALNEAITKTGKLASATKKTRSIWETIRGEQQQGNMLDAKTIAGLISTEINKRNENELKTINTTHSKGRSIESSKAMETLSKEFEAIARTKSMNTSTGDKTFLMHDKIKNLQASIHKYIKENVNSKEESQYVNDLLNDIEKNGQIVHPNVIHNLRKQLASKVEATVDVKPKQAKETVESKVQDVKELNTKTSEPIISKSTLVTKQAVAGVLRTNVFNDLREVGIVRQAIKTLTDSGEIHKSLSDAMNKRLDMIERLTAQHVENDVVLKERQAESIKAAENLTAIKSILSDYYPEITAKDIGELIKDPSDDVFDKMVKMICG